MRPVLGFFLFHLGQHVSDNLSLVLRNHQQMRPGEDVVQVISHRVVFGQVEEVAVLHLHQVLHLRGGEWKELNQKERDAKFNWPRKLKGGTWVL